MKYDTKRLLKVWRNMAGYTQETFAEAVGVDRATVSMWETGKHQPNGRSVAKIEELLGIKWADDILMPEA